MNAYIYQAAQLCEPCAEAEIERLRALRNLDCQCQDPDCRPQGPYPDGCGESDTPSHCDKCQLFLENPLTDDGVRYVIEHIGLSDNPMSLAVTSQWSEFYADELANV